MREDGSFEAAFDELFPRETPAPLVTGDVEGAAKFLVDMARVGPGGDPMGFRRAVVDLSRRFVMHAAQGEFSIAQLILESVGLGGRFRVFFPVEMTLMVKALVTFEGVGHCVAQEAPGFGILKTDERHRITEFYEKPRLEDLDGMTSDYTATPTQPIDAQP